MNIIIATLLSADFMSLTVLHKLLNSFNPYNIPEI